MKNYHWLAVLMFLVIGYFVGVKFPSQGQSLLSKVGV